ncbi:MAG: YhjD/YihY/BrkB family envelope integrity protein [Parachlamydiaceae bacterium]
MAKTFNELFPRSDDQTPRKLRIWSRILRVVYDSVRGFIEDDCYSKASALTFYSLLSVVPTLAVLFGIAKGFGLENALELEISEKFIEQKELVQKLIEFAYSWLHTVKGGVIAGFGVFILFWSILGLLSSIETTLNAIWKTPISRTFGRRISDYLAAIVICPFFFITSSSITVWLGHFTQLSQHQVFVDVVSPFVLFILKCFPYFLSATLFTFVYFFLPNTKVYMRSALIAGIIGGSAFQIWQWIYIKFQFVASSYGAIYGSFAALPLFLIWLQISWLILLAGAELAFEIENDLFIPFRRTLNLSSKAVALLLTYRCIESFVKGEIPQTERSLAHEIGISLNHLHTILEALQKEGIISKVYYKDKASGYQPARSLESITFALVCQAMDKSHYLLASVRESIPFQNIQQALEESNSVLATSSFNQPVYPTNHE